MNDKVLLVGSIPLDTVQDVFATFGQTLGTYLPAIPDGEIGHRKHWISRVHYEVFANHPDLEILRRPRRDDGVERLNPHDHSDGWKFRVKPEVDIVRFGDRGWRLGFARDAINSYFVFCTLRDKGLLPGHLRFQVSIPMVNSVCPPRTFESLADLEKIKPGYQDALRAELEKICEKIPARDLAIQWDCAVELQDAYGAIQGFPAGDRIERNVGEIRALSPLVPRDALLGYHLCFGTLGGWPHFSPEDLRGAVALANAYLDSSGRHVDWMHIPAVERTDDAFYRPLSDLKPGRTRVYLGLIHNMNTFADRVASARKFLPDFGVAAYCGFGRLPVDQIPSVLEEHKLAASMI